MSSRTEHNSDYDKRNIHGFWHLHLEPSVITYVSLYKHSLITYNTPRQQWNILLILTDSRHFAADSHIGSNHDWLLPLLADLDFSGLEKTCICPETRPKQIENGVHMFATLLGLAAYNQVM